MIKLILSDMDGTLLDSQGQVDQARLQTMKTLLKQADVHFAAVTGKQAERVENLFGELAKDVWILGDSATRIKYNGEFIYESLLPKAVGKAIIQTIETIAPEVTIIACTKEAAVIRTDLPEQEKQVVRGSYQVVKEVNDHAEVDEDFVKITVFDIKKRAFQIKPQLDQYLDQAYIVASEPAWIDIANYGVHKGTTVKELQRLLGITKQETMAFGDGLNDLELMKESHYSFAVSNAVDDVKKAARYVTKSNDEAAVFTTVTDLLHLQMGSEGNEN
jgi:hypothetical protein